MKEDDAVKVLVAQQDHVQKSEEKMVELKECLEKSDCTEFSNSEMLSEIDKRCTDLFQSLGIKRENVDLRNIEPKIYLSEQELIKIDTVVPTISLLDHIGVEESKDWNTFLLSVESYAERNGLDLTRDPFKSLLSEKQKKEIENRLKNEFTLKRCNCDKYDYMIAATCGAIGGLIDAFYVGLPGHSNLGQFTDKQVDKVVQKFAKLCKWQGPKEGSDPTRSAIGYLERKFLVNYDHRHGGDVKNAIKMSTTNHHLKSLAHSPDIVGLFFSILNQFTNTASFLDGGNLIKIKTEDNNRFKLQGHSFASRIFCGFTNWFGHLMSDLAGSSGAIGRGSGIPIPFYSLLQLINVGKFGQDRQTFAKIAVQVFERGYDLRHGLTMAIPVAITEVMIRLMWVFKRRFYHNQSWEESMPFGNIAELNRMLLTGHGTLCLIDLTDAGIRSGGNWVNLFLRMNLIGWVRLGLLGLKEVRSIYKFNEIEAEKMDEELKNLFNETMQQTRFLN